MSNLKLTISDVIKDLGIPANLSGYHYIKYAAELVVNDISYMNKMTTRLYPDIAEHFNTSATKVERAIRNAIEEGWYRGNIYTQNKLFGYTIKQGEDNPTNSEFIMTVADYINMLEGEDESK